MSDIESPNEPWQSRAGLRLACGWDVHAVEPYANALLVALMARFPNVHFVVAFDGFFYDKNDVEGETQAEPPQLCTLSLWVVARRTDEYAGAYVEDALSKAHLYSEAYIEGWQAGRTGRCS